MDKRSMRRKNILYRLRKKGIRCLTKQRLIFFPYGGEPMDIIQIKRLREEFGFSVQFEIV